MNETRTIPGYSKFKVDRVGNVYNQDNRLLKHHNSNGYRRISLEKDNGKRSGVDVHRLIASTFLGPIPKGMWVNHENGDKADNRVENLKVDTPSYNHHHAFNVLGRTAGYYNPLKARAMQILNNNGMSQHQIAKVFECSQPNVSTMLKRHATEEGV